MQQDRERARGDRLEHCRRRSLTAPRAAATLLALFGIACAADRDGTGLAAAGAPTRTVVFLGAASELTLPAEEAAALAWLRAQAGVQTRFLQIEDLAANPPPTGSLLWWHYAERPELPSLAMGEATLAAVRAHLAGGSPMLLSLIAATWVVPLRVETTAHDQVELVPGTDFLRWGDNPQEDRVLAGFASRAGHPLLRRFWGSTFSATPHPGRRYAVARYTGANRPSEGEVLAVARRFIRTDPSLKTIVEYRSAGGRPAHLLTIGEGLWFADADNRNRIHLELLASDAFTYLLGELPTAPPGAAIPSTGANTVPVETTMAADEAAPSAPGTPTDETEEEPVAEPPPILREASAWSAAESRTLAFAPTPTEPIDAPETATVLEAITAARSGLQLQQPVEAAEPFDLASPRALLLGTQHGLVREMWAYPQRVLRNLRFGVAPPGPAPIEWLDAGAFNRTFTARPEGDSVLFEGDGINVSLHLAVARDSPSLVALLQVTSDTPVSIIAAWEADHVPMWPADATHLADLEMGWDAGAMAAVWRGADGFAAYGGFGVPSTWRLGFDPTADVLGGELGTFEEIAPGDPVVGPAFAVQVDLQPTEGTANIAIPFVVAASLDGQDAARSTFGELLVAPASVWTANANYYRQFLAETVEIATPDPTFNEAFRWAKVGIETLRVTTPGVGTGLVAGYAPSHDPRWNEDSWAAENDFLRRPGYAWYFGRDSVWTALAADAYGGGDLASEVLRFLARYQDVDGKILHEASPSLSLHYDAADSTPLFLLGLDHHVRATGDRELLRELWPAVRRAVGFLQSTDTDGDGLIENTGVGHGWIEGGRFYGAHTTLYLASLWAASLEAVERLAVLIADDEFAQQAAAAGAVARDVLQTDFWNDDDRYFYYGKRLDGSFMTHRTILPAVTMYWGLVDEARVRPLAEAFAGADLTADWGVRMTPRSSPDYEPTGYHDGAAWPLYAGWTSLGAYRYHRPLAAFAQANANLRLHRHGNLGYIPEALHGERFESIGVTSHQGWSQAMAVLPVIEGLLGIRPDATAGRMRIHPHLPGGWNQVTVQPLRIGQDTFRVTITRGDDTSGFLLERLAGTTPLQLQLSLPFPRDVLVNLDRDATTGVTVPDGERIVDHPTEKEVIVDATFTEGRAQVMFRHSPYPQVVVPLPSPQRGASSSALRILDSTFRSGTLALNVEGLPGRAYRLNLTTPWSVTRISGVPQASVVTAGPGRAAIEFTIPGTGELYQRAALQLEFRR